MSTYQDPEARSWTDIEVRGTPMKKCAVFEGHGARSAFFRMPAGCQIPDHHHANWVQVAVISGRMRVEQSGEPVRYVAESGVYFISPGEDHIETSEVDSLVLVTQGEDRDLAMPARSA